MSRLILHFGMNKTGSSSIQHWLFNESRDPNFAYISLGHPNMSRAVSTLFRVNPGDYHANRQYGVDGVRLKKLLKRFDTGLDNAFESAREAENAIISAEDLTDFFEVELSRLVDRASRYFSRIEAVGYVRSPRSFMESAFQQRVKGGMRSFNLNACFPHYDRCLLKFDSVLGADNCRFWIFDPRTLLDGCVVRDFCQKIGVQCPSTLIPRYNESISLDAVKLLYIYAKFAKVENVATARKQQVLRKRRLLITHLKSLSGPKFQLHSDLVEPLLQEYRDSIEWIQQRIGQRFPSEIRTDQSYAIRGEEDLLQVSKELLSRVVEESGSGKTDNFPRNTEPANVARWLRRFVNEQIRRAAAS